MAKRIGIYAGTFDPVHAGHLAFALQALKAAGLDKVYFLPERRPRGKGHVEHFGHRVAMLRQATKPHPQFEVLELPDVSFSVRYTLPRLRKQFGDSQLFFLFGSDIVSHLPEWPLAERLVENELIIGVRNQDDSAKLQQAISGWPLQPRAIMLLPSYAPTVSSGKIRRALGRGSKAKGSLSSVARYSNRHWLYVQLADRG
jgi:nicotinate (nicotinamide) nucleotide adenylyltransferase